MPEGRKCLKRSPQELEEGPHSGSNIIVQFKGGPIFGLGGFGGVQPESKLLEALFFSFDLDIFWGVQENMGGGGSRQFLQCQNMSRFFFTGWQFPNTTYYNTNFE